MSIFVAHDMFAVEGVLRPGDVYLEIGAHRGQFLRASHYLEAAVGAHFILYEPGGVRQQLEADLVKPAKDRGIDIAVYPEAVWSHDGSVPYHADANDGQGNTLLLGVHPFSQHVQAMTLAQVFARHGISRVRFLALNAEQAEYRILAAPEMEQVDYVTVELHPGLSKIDSRVFVQKILPGFETLAFGREKDDYNQWLGTRMLYR